MDLPKVIFLEATPEEFEPKLLKKVKASGGVLYEVVEGGCHVLTSHVPKGAGQAAIQRKGKYYSLALIAFVQHNGPVPKGHKVFHTCRNLGCINPAHLVTGTPTEARREARISKFPDKAGLITNPLTARDKEIICCLARYGTPKRIVTQTFCITEADLIDVVKEGRRLEGLGLAEAVKEGRD